MRKTILGGLLLSGLLAITGNGQPPGSNAAKQPGPKPETLEDDIARTLRTHPDVKVAEAEAQLANAKVQQVKLALAQRVAAAKREKDRSVSDVGLSQMRIQTARRAADANLTLVDRLKQRHAAGQVSASEISAAEQEREKAMLLVLDAEQGAVAAKAKAAAADAEYDGLVGKAAAGQASIALDAGVVVLNGQSFVRVGLDERFELAARFAAAEPKPGSVAEKLRTALATPVVYEAKNRSIELIVKDLKAAAGVNVVLRAPEGFRATFNFDKLELPLGGWLELARDEFNASTPAVGGPGAKAYEWYVREYGLLLSANGRPEGAMTLGEFLKAIGADKKPDAPKK